MFNNFHPSILTKHISKVEFSILSEEQKLKLSHTEVNESYGVENGITKPHSLYDGSMGAITRGIKCLTCKLDTIKDPGHFGIINLSTNIINVIFIKHVIAVLRCICFQCCTFLINDEDTINIIKEYPLNLRMSYCKHHVKNKKFGICSVCKFDNTTIAYKVNKKINIEYRIGKAGSYISLDPSVIKFKFSKLKRTDIECMGFIPGVSDPERFIIKSVLVTPNPTRHSAMRNEGNQKTENNMTKLFSILIKENNKLSKKLQYSNIFDPKTKGYFEALNYAYSSMVTDNTATAGGVVSLQSGKKIASIKETLKGKEGLIKGNLSGKRVDYSARTVISSDANIDIDQVGIPIYILLKQSIPEIINRHNIEYMKKVILNGKTIYPGANKVIKHKNNIELYLGGTVDKLDMISKGLEIGDIVFRHPIKNDYVLFNRQPTLSKESILGFRVLPIKNKLSFRLNNCSTNPFNADFDGDEMNVYFLHKDTSVAEIKYIMMAKHHIIGSRQSQVIIGPIQDNILGLWLISKARGKVITKSTFLYILGSAVYFDINHISEIEERNEGKFYYEDLYECILPNNFSFNNNSLNIMNGRLLSGYMTKDNIYRMIKVIFHNYNVDVTKNIISALQRISDTYLMFRGYSIGIQDCTVDKETKEKISNIIIEAQKNNYELLDQYDRGEISTSDDYEIRAINIIGDCNKQTRTVINEYLSKNNNPMVSMVEAKSKGSWENIYQLLIYVGQKIIDGTRIPKTMGDRTYVNYARGENTLVSRGFIVQSYADGLSPQQFFDEGVTTRSDLIEKVLGVAKAGYANKRLNKVMEPFVVEYDHTIRMNGKIISSSFGGFGWDLIYLSDNTVTLINHDLDSLLNEYL